MFRQNLPMILQLKPPFSSGISQPATLHSAKKNPGAPASAKSPIPSMGHQTTLAKATGSVSRSVMPMVRNQPNTWGIRVSQTKHTKN